jgi:arylsulfatase A-like enzyme
MHCRIRPGAITTPVVLTLAGVTAVLGSVHPIDAAAAAEGDQKPRPNLVFVLADDLGWSDLSTGRANGLRGHDFNRTPAIDRLAAEGQSFTEAYASLQCSPTRTALHTGQYATRPTNNVYSVHNPAGAANNPLLGVTQGRIAEDGAVAVTKGHVTVGETLQKAGYTTVNTGKFHVTGSSAEIVQNHGFDENWGGGPNSHATRYFASDGKFNESVPPELDTFAGEYTEEYIRENIAPYSEEVSADQLAALEGTDKHVTDAVTDATLDFFERRKDEPFFAFVNQFAPHFPVDDGQARRDLLAKYRAKTPGVDPAKPSYAALTEGVDQSVARIVDYLENTPDPRNDDRPLAENTLVIFSSDNGGKVSAGSLNKPLRGAKRIAYEGGVRVPWIAWSGSKDLVRGGIVNRTIVNSTDLYRTLASYAEAPLPAGVPLDGVDLRPAFSTGARIDRENFYHHAGYVGRQAPASSVRDGRWKLYYGYTKQSFKLYDLRKDIGETTNIAKKRPRTVNRLGRTLVRWLNATDAPLATLRPGQPKLVLKNVRGRTYSDGTLKRRRGAKVVIKPGKEVPFVLPAAPSKQKKKATKK